MALNFDLIEPGVLTGFVRELPVPANYVLNRFLPDRNIGDIEAAFTTAFTRNRAAMFRAFDAETPIGERDNFQRSRVALPPLSQKMLVGEEERLKLEMLRSGGDNTAGMIQALYNDARINTEAILARMELARGQVLTTGKFSFAGENGLKGIEANFGVDTTGGTPGSHLPTAGTAWTDHDNADPLEDMRTWSDTYTDDAGEQPAYFITSRQAIGHLLRNAAVRSRFSTLGGTPTVITRSQLAAVLDSEDLPQLVQYDSQVYDLQPGPRPGRHGDEGGRPGPDLDQGRRDRHADHRRRQQAAGCDPLVTEGRALTRLVILDGEVWPVGSVPPAAVAERIRNPKCWAPVEDEPELPWGPEGMPAVGTASTPVVPAQPASGIPNLQEKTGDSAVIPARPGTPIARDPAEVSGQAFANGGPVREPGPAEDDSAQLHDRVAVDDETAAADSPSALLSEPPRSGRGASTAAWRAYAQQFGAEVPDDAEKLRSIAVIGRRSRPVIRDGRRADGIRVKVTETEAGRTVEHATKDDRVDAYATPQTLTVTRADIKEQADAR
jgi:hypothetical protein